MNTFPRDGEQFGAPRGALFTEASVEDINYKAARGLDKRQIAAAARGHTHSSLTLVDVVISGVPYRQRMCEALRRFGREDGQPPRLLTRD